jgi:DNA-binding MarR family transcriptional regulator
MGVIGRLSRLTRHLEGTFEERVQAQRLGVGGFDVLAALRRAGRPYRITPNQLYNSLLISSGAMTNRIDRLERQGLASRAPNPHDRRSVLVALTPKGKRVIDEAVSDHVTKENKLLSTLWRRNGRKSRGFCASSSCRWKGRPTGASGFLTLRRPLGHLGYLDVKVRKRVANRIGDHRPEERPVPP